MNNLDKNNNKRFALGLHSDTKKDIFSIFLIAFGVISFLGFFNIAGVFGEVMTNVFYMVFGITAFLIPLVFIIIGVLLLKSDQQKSFFSCVWGLVFFVVSFLATIEVLAYKVSWLNVDKEIVSYAGGYVGFAFSYPFLRFLGFWASLILFVAFLIASLLIALNVSFKTLLRMGKDKKYKVMEKTNSHSELSSSDYRRRDEDSGSTKKDDNKSFLTNLASKILPKPKFNVKSIKNGESEKEERVEQSKKQLKKDENYQYPNLDLLESGKSQPSVGDITVNSNIIKRTLESFGIDVEMSGVNIGPTVTQYTLKPSTGVKLSNITSLNNDLALSLAAHPIRIEAPIPGQSLVGIEIPNRSPAIVKLRHLMESEEYENRKSQLSLCLGKDVAGAPIIAALDKMPHLLIAGSTGSGKTVVLNAIINSLLFQNSPDNLRFILIDPKRVEFSSYNNIPHLLSPVVVEPNKAINALKWAVSEMERRFKILQKAKSRDLQSYHEKYEVEIKKNPESDWDNLPFIVVIIDELADLMASHGREIEAVIVRLAQMSRAVGIHIILATQRPSVEVITGLIKANITSRIACQVASQIDSRTILDMAGAEKLLGNGDMLFVGGDSRIKRIQGSYISEKEVHNIARFLIKNSSDNNEEYDKAITENSASLAAGSKDIFSNTSIMDDDMYDQAKETVIAAGKASASLLQRRLRVGYARAARLIDLLEEQGIIGPADGARPREILEIQNKDTEE